MRGLRFINLFRGNWSERHFKALMSRVGGQRQLKRHLMMADGSIHHSEALMDDCNTVGHNFSQLKVSNPKRYAELYDESAKVARLYYWFYGRIPLVVPDLCPYGPTAYAITD